jgi:hypothetical protein
MKIITITIVVSTMIAVILTTIYYDNRYLKLEMNKDCYLGALTETGNPVRFTTPDGKLDEGHEAVGLYKICKRK